ncbi:MAG TPA: tetratricopeptide repeat protein [Thermoanaerobaculia bacterium]|nr:tetratricopeptide repeat protein [Thermoanaerobaculia bacterium]
MKIHPHDDVLEGFLLSMESGHRAVLRHLQGCAYCRSRLAYLPRAAETEAVPGVIHPDAGTIQEAARAVAAREVALERERDEAPGLFLELVEPPAEEREALLGRASRFHTWGVFELLVERSLEVTLKDPAHGESLGVLALRLADHLDTERYGAEHIADFRARAWAYRGNACRMRFDFPAAEAAFLSAHSLLKEGTGDGVERAILLDLRASLRRAQRRFGEALRLLGRAVVIFLGAGEGHRAGRSLVKLSTVHHHAGNPAAGIPLLHQALELIDPEREPRLLLCARHNLIFYQAELGRFQEAQTLYREARPLYRSFDEPWVQNRRSWVRGKIARGLGQLKQAEARFLAARDGFLNEGVPYDTALVSLELALLYAEQGRTAELKRLAAEMVPVFASRHVHREALAALTFLRQAVEAERASLDVVVRVADFLRKSEHDPELRFEAQG